MNGNERIEKTEENGSYIPTCITICEKGFYSNYFSVSQNMQESRTDSYLSGRLN